MNTRPHNIQDDNWRLFTDVPISSELKRNTVLGYKVFTNPMDSIDNDTFRNLLLYQGHKIDTLHEISHPQVD